VTFFDDVREVQALVDKANQLETFMEKAIRLVTDVKIEELDKSDPPAAHFEVYVVWFSKTLQNWKALLSSTISDGMYYEVTYNGDKKETYIDSYKKLHNVAVKDEK
jgi:hypothetical protein